MGSRYSGKTPSAGQFVTRACCTVLASAGIAWGTGDVPVTQIPNDGETIAVRSWLVSGMFPSPDLAAPKPDGPRRAGYDTGYLTAIGGEAAARPREGTTVRLPDGGEVTFRFHAWEDDYVNLVDLFGMPSEVLAYLYCEVESPVEQEVYVHVGTNDAGKVWLGGELVIAYPGDRSAEKSQNVAKVRLPAGRTRLLVKVDQAGFNWGAFVEFYGRTAHEGILAASSPDTLRAAKEALDRLRRELGDPLALIGPRRDAYALALYHAERIDRDVPGGEKPGEWNRERLLVPQYMERLRRAIEGARAGVDPYAGKTGLFEAAYLSEADGTAQPFTLWVPDDYTPGRSYALLLDLHGAGGTHERAGDWWTGICPADSLYRSTTIGASVMGRGRWSGYQGLGEEDILRVTEWVREHYSIDPDRVYVSGGSMGGRGSWLLPSRYPDRYAAAWPDMGWPEFQTLPNLLNLPTYVNHGAVDWVVPVSFSRLAARRLKEIGSPVLYTEWPDVGHAVSGPARNDGCMAKMAAHRRITDPPHIRIHAEHPRYATMYWGSIERWIDPHAVASLDAYVLPGNVVSVNVSNVARARLTPPQRHLDERGEIVWLAGGQRMVTPRNPNGSYDIIASDTSVAVRAHRDEPEPTVRPYTPGSVVNLYCGEPLLIVYGTQSPDDSVKKAIREMAEEVRHWLMPSEWMEFGKMPVVADTEITSQQMASKNLFLIGGLRENRVAARLMAKLPVREEGGVLRVFDERPIPLDSRGYAFIYPNSEYPSRLVFFYGSSVPQFYTHRRSELASWSASDLGSLNPDLVVHTVARVDSAGDPRQNLLVRRRYFTHGWRLADVPDGAITRHPADSREDVARSARAWVRATGAEFAFAPAVKPGEPVRYERESITWADFGIFRADLVTFDVKGVDLVRFERHDRADVPWILPSPDSSAIDRGRAYRVVAPTWMLWDLGGAHHYNPENVELVDADALVDLYRREEWGVRNR